MDHEDLTPAQRATLDMVEEITRGEVRFEDGYWRIYSPLYSLPDNKPEDMKRVETFYNIISDALGEEVIVLSAILVKKHNYDDDTPSSMHSITIPRAPVERMMVLIPPQYLDKENLFKDSLIERLNRYKSSFHTLSPIITPSEAEVEDSIFSSNLSRSHSTPVFRGD